MVMIYPKKKKLFPQYLFLSWINFQYLFLSVINLVLQWFLLNIVNMERVLERIKMSTRGGVNSRTWKSQTFSRLLDQVRRLWIFFRILREIRRIRENVRTVRPAKGELNRQDLNLLKSKSVKIGYALKWFKPVYPLKTCRNLNTK
jgi:hypothetical protein